MDTKPPPLEERKPSLSHLDEYKALHDEITLYQHEIHRTWLWAIITAGAIYAWLASHSTVINGFPKIFVVFLPVFLFASVPRGTSISEAHRSNWLLPPRSRRRCIRLENGAKLPGFVHFSQTVGGLVLPSVLQSFVVILDLLFFRSFLHFILRVSAAHQTRLPTIQTHQRRTE